MNSYAPSTINPDKQEQILNDYSEIIESLKRERKKHKSVVIKQDINLEKPAWARVNPGPMIDKNKNSYRLCLGFKNIGCAYREKDRKKLGCLNCGYYANTAFKDVDDTIILKQFQNAIATGKKTKTKFNSIEFLNDGSFFNTDEISKSLQVHLFHLISEMPDIGRVLVESRPEYITHSGILNLIGQLREDQIFEIGIGLESADDFVREKCINKGFSKIEFEEVIDSISDLKQTNKDRISIVTYLLVKPAFLNQREGIADIINSMHYLQKLSNKYGVQITPKLEPAAIVEGTILSMLHRDKKSKFSYEPLNYWVILEILTKLASDDFLKPLLKIVRIGAREDMDDIIKAPAIYADGENIFYPFDFVIYESIQKFNQHHNFDHLFSTICEVYKRSNNMDLIKDYSLNKWLIDNQIENSAIVEFFKHKVTNSDIESQVEIDFMMMIYKVLDIIEGYNKNYLEIKNEIDASLTTNSKKDLKESIAHCFFTLFPEKPIEVFVNTLSTNGKNAEIFFDAKYIRNNLIMSIWSRFSLSELAN